MAGAVTVNGRPGRRPGQLLEAGQRLGADVDLQRLEAARTSTEDAATAGRFDVSASVLFEDDWLLAVAKPAGLQVHASADSARPDLFALVRAWLAARPGSTGEGGHPTLALHQRLDIETSGVVLFAIDPAANVNLARSFADHQIDKRYEAITARPAQTPPHEWIARGSLAMTGSGRQARARVVEGGQPAQTSFRVVRTFPHALLIEAGPRTGRKHQVRAHLADAGLPILGDVRYGGPRSAAGAPAARVMLHAAALSLDHPITRRPLRIQCPRPRDFEDLLQRLGTRRASLDTSRPSR
jgi:RluA family pseudouridine synthase